MIVKVLQKGAHDCGVACLAMASGITYEDAYETFKSIGLGKCRGRKQEFSSNSTELQNALASVGVSSKLKRFKSFSALPQMAIVKVAKQINGNWHWVFVGRDTELGLYLHDPSNSLPTFETIPLDVLCVDISSFSPYGFYIEIGARNYSYLFNPISIKFKHPSKS